MFKVIKGIINFCSTLIENGMLVNRLGMSPLFVGCIYYIMSAALTAKVFFWKFNPPKITLKFEKLPIFLLEAIYLMALGLILSMEIDYLSNLLITKLCNLPYISKCSAHFRSQVTELTDNFPQLMKFFDKNWQPKEERERFDKMILQSFINLSGQIEDLYNYNQELSFKLIEQIVKPEIMHDNEIEEIITKNVGTIDQQKKRNLIDGFKYLNEISLKDPKDFALRTKQQYTPDQFTKLVVKAAKDCINDKNLPSFN